MWFYTYRRVPLSIECRKYCPRKIVFDNFKKKSQKILKGKIHENSAYLEYPLIINKVHFPKRNTSKNFGWISGNLFRVLLCKGSILCQKIIHTKFIIQFPILLPEIGFQKMLYPYWINQAFVRSSFKRPKKNDLIMLILPDFQLDLNWPFTQTFYNTALLNCKIVCKCFFITKKLVL